MTILNFQDALMKETGNILKGVGTKNASGENVDGVNLFACLLYTSDAADD